MFVFPGRIPAFEGSLQSGQKYHFTYEDYIAIREQARTLRGVSPVINREDIRAVSDYGSTNGQVFVVAPDYNEIRTIPIGHGRWFNYSDNIYPLCVAILGLDVIQCVFLWKPAVGAT